MGLAAVILLGGIGGGGYWWTHRGEPVVEAKAIETTPGMVTFEPFVVNLADTDASRFLRVKIQLVVGSAEQGAKIQETPVVLMQARSIILEVLTTQKSDELTTPAGKTALKASIKERVHAALGEAEVKDVLFSDFVVQF